MKTPAALDRVALLRRLAYPRRPRRRGLGALPAAALLLVLVVSACSAGGPAAQPADGRIHVLASTTVIADLARSAGGDHVVVDALVPAGVDPHTFSPRPSTLRRIADADVILLNGLGLDDWLQPLIADARKAGAVVVDLGPDQEGVTYLVGSPEGGAATTVPAGPGEPVNPHLWLDAAYAERYVVRIAETLAAVRPAYAAAIGATSDAYRARLRDLDAAIRDALAAIPPVDRRVVSFHDAFPYYAAAYGLDVAGVVVRAPGQEPNAGDIAALVDAIRASGTKAILAEAQFNPRVADRIAEETGATVVTDLYTDTLGPPPADSYVGMMLWDTDRIVEALQ